jgi:hypothetical protein
MAYHDDELLFYKYDLGETLRGHISTAAKAVDSIPEREFVAATDDALVEKISRDFEICPLELLEAERTMTRDETKVDVSGHPDRNPFRDRGPIYVAGIHIVISTPFRGDPKLWGMRPNAWQSTFPRGKVRKMGGQEGGTLEIEYTKPADENNDRLKQFIDSTFKDIRFYMDNQKRQIEQELARLPRAVSEAIHRRKERLRAHDDLSDVLGIPMGEKRVRTDGGTADTGAPAPQSDRSEKPAKKGEVGAPRQWDVFVSHASEDKPTIARPLAAALREQGLSVWFDEMTLKVGDSLRRSIDQGLAKSRFGIVIVSPAFLQKEWPQRELDGLVARESHGKKVILPVWHEVDAAIVAQYSPTLADRLAVRSDIGLEKVVQAIKDAMR